MPWPTLPGGLGFGACLPVGQDKACREKGWFGSTWNAEKTLSRAAIQARDPKQWYAVRTGYQAQRKDRRRVLGVIDVDVRGKVDGRTLYASWGLPATFTDTTPSGGAHYFFWLDREIASGPLAPGVDFKCKAGYVVAPGMPGYEVADTPHLLMAELSAYVVEKLKVKGNGQADHDGQYQFGERHNELTSYLAGLWDGHAKANDLRRLALEYMESEFVESLPRGEVDAIIRWIIKQQPSGSPHEPAPDVKEPEAEDDRPATFPDPVPDVEVRAQVAALPPRLSLLGPLATAQVGIMFAAEGVGKSMLAHYTADAICRGCGLGPWEGSGVKRRVLYVDAEMDKRDIDDRIELIGSGHGIDFVMSEDWPDGGLDLCDSRHQDILCAWAGDYDAVILDNTSQLLTPPADRDEWSPQVWQLTGRLRGWFRKHNHHLLWIDHTNAKGGVQGTMAKRREVFYIIKLAGPVLY